jgi:hypothetical protein
MLATVIGLEEIMNINTFEKSYMIPKDGFFISGLQLLGAFY